MMQEDREILQDFIAECNDGLEQVERTLLELEAYAGNSTQTDNDLIDTLFRTFHSIKGSAGFIGLNKINGLTHHAETLLDLIRKGQIAISKEHIDLLLEVSDALQTLIDYLGEHFTEEGYTGADLEHLQNRLRERAAGETIVEKKEQKICPEENEGDGETSRQNHGVQSYQTRAEFQITDNMVRQFLSEAHDLLNGIEQALLQLENNPADIKPVESAFRSLHSLKGNAGFLNYSDIYEICHKAEESLDGIRKGTIRMGSRQISLLLKIVDFIRDALNRLSEKQTPRIPGKPGLLDLMNEGLFSDAISNHQIETPDPEEKTDASYHQNVQEKSAQKSEKKPQRAVNSQLMDINKNVRSASQSEVIRVDVGKLDRLMDLVGEIVIAESMVSHNPKIDMEAIEGFEQSINYLRKNVRELQDLATSMRMIPLSGLFGKMRRLVRDIASKTNKKVRLDIKGGETEVDRSILERISDPLVHILRNAIDHGIENAEERKRKGKDPVGRLSLEARQVGGEIWISVRDDGAGLDRQTILKKALERKLVAGDEAETMEDEKVWNLILKAGFSTTENVSDISGRGVGMDVVTRNVEKIRGRVQIQSETALGTTITLRIPLTTAIIDGMVLRVGDWLYAIPTLDIKESMRVSKEEVLQLIDGQEVIHVRDQIIPVIQLRELHRIEKGKYGIDEGIVVIAENAGRNVGFLIDELFGQQQLVIKALPAYLGKIDGVSGCALLGNGDICLILDLANLIKFTEMRPTDV